MKTRVKITNDSSGRFLEYQKGETGFVDGYVVEQYNMPQTKAVVVSDRDKRFVLVPLYDLEYIGEKRDLPPIMHPMTCGVAQESETPLPDFKEMSRVMLEDVLDRNQGNRKKAAQELGISDRTMYRRMKQFGLI